MDAGDWRMPQYNEATLILSTFGTNSRSQQDSGHSYGLEFAYHYSIAITMLSYMNISRVSRI